VVEALRERVIRAVDADPVPLLVHRDLHPLNIVAGPHGPVALDWAEAGWGNRSDDFAWLHVAVTRFGAPLSVLEEARAGYEDVAPGRCPSIEQIRAAGRVRELICLAFSIQNAALSPDHRHEAQIELPILDDPDATTPPWTPLFNRAAFTHPPLGSDLRRWAS
jgi:Ser/Thr protein kinase RdoA (MazF antagonist)